MNSKSYLMCILLQHDQCFKLEKVIKSMHHRVCDVGRDVCFFKKPFSSNKNIFKFTPGAAVPML